MFEYINSSSIDFDNYSQTSERFCDNCNTSLTDILNSGVVGCANCYKTFQNEIRNVLIRTQGCFNHMGKLAIKRFSKQKIEDEIKSLEEQKQKAVENENFIVAESLKNQIEKLRGSV